MIIECVFLISHVKFFRVNVGCGPAEERVLLTGLHAVADIYCESCKTMLGWKYVCLYYTLLFYLIISFILITSLYNFRNMPSSLAKSTRKANSSLSWRTWSKRMVGTRRSLDDCSRYDLSTRASCLCDRSNRKLKTMRRYSNYATMLGDYIRRTQCVGYRSAWALRYS